MTAIGEKRFRNREDAGQQLAELFRARSLWNPLVLAIPRGGVEVGAALARMLGAELDIVLARKLRSPFQPEFALGAIGEDEAVSWNPDGPPADELPAGYLEAERKHQRSEIARRKRLLRGTRAPSRVADRSVIVTDDGIATGSTMIAALRSIRGMGASEIIVAVPVAPADRLDPIRRWCDELVCLIVAEDFTSVGEFYDDFDTVEDDDVVRVLGEFARPKTAMHLLGSGR